MKDLLKQVEQEAFNDELEKIARTMEMRSSTPLTRQPSAGKLSAPKVTWGEAAKSFKGNDSIKSLRQAVAIQKGADRGSAQWASAQNMINQAYGRGPTNRVAQAQAPGAGAKAVAQTRSGRTIGAVKAPWGAKQRQQVLAAREVGNEVAPSGAQPTAVAKAPAPAQAVVAQKQAAKPQGRGVWGSIRGFFGGGNKQQAEMSPIARRAAVMRGRAPKSSGFGSPNSNRLQALANKARQSVGQAPGKPGSSGERFVSATIEGGKVTSAKGTSNVKGDVKKAGF